MNKIDRIIEKLDELRSLDAKFQTFGSEKHRYEMNAATSILEIETFESQQNIKLPSDFREFLIRVGNGGAGPYYGLESLNDSLFIDLDYKRVGEILVPSIPFPLSEPWNIEFAGDPEDEEAYEEFEREYFDGNWSCGLLRICNFGCGVSLNLVVNGEEYGNIWVDDRVNDGGIYPDPYFDQQQRVKFVEWYELWLDRSIQDLKHI
jgi:hypothetical protein